MQNYKKSSGISCTFECSVAGSEYHIGDPDPGKCDTVYVYVAADYRRRSIDPVKNSGVINGRISPLSAIPTVMSSVQCPVFSVQCPQCPPPVYLARDQVSHASKQASKQANPRRQRGGKEVTHDHSLSPSRGTLPSTT